MKVLLLLVGANSPFLAGAKLKLTGANVGQPDPAPAISEATQVYFTLTVMK